MDWQNQLKSDPLPWLLDPAEPGVRYLALRDLMDAPTDDSTLRQARADAHTSGPIGEVLSHMQPEGWWGKAGPGYGPKYFSTVWALILLAQLGATAETDARIGRACTYYLDHALHPGGQISAGMTPAGTFDCLQGNMLAALMLLGCRDERLQSAYEWMARTVTGEGMTAKTDKHAARRYSAYKCGPCFACRANNGLPCAWGGVKVMLAFSLLPQAQRTPLIERAITEGAEFLLAGNPAQANYPNGYADRPSENWWRFGFPVLYVTDLLQNVETLVRLGHAHDPRLAAALEIIRAKQDSAGRWLMEFPYGSRTWMGFGRRGKPNKWVTLRALRVLKAAA